MLKEDTRTLSCVCDESGKDQDGSAGSGQSQWWREEKGGSRRGSEQGGAPSGGEELGGALPRAGRQDSPSSGTAVPRP